MSRLTADALGSIGEGDYDDEDATAVDQYDEGSSSSDSAGNPPLEISLQDDDAATGAEPDSMASSVHSEDERMARAYDSTELEQKVAKLAEKLSTQKTQQPPLLPPPAAAPLPSHASSFAAPQSPTVWQAPWGMLWYFAYGSNMNVAQLLSRLGPFEERRLMALDNYRLRFNKKVSLKKASNLGFANVEPMKGETVYGIAYLLNPSQMDAMDCFEGVGSGHYYRATVACRDVVNSDSKVWCEVYIAMPQSVGEGLLPTAAYLSHLVAGRSMLPPQYLHTLETQEVAQETTRKQFF